MTSEVIVEPSQIKAESRVFDLKDLNASMVSRIAAEAIKGPAINTNITHAIERRYASDQLLTHLSNLPSGTQVNFEVEKIGNVYNPETKRLEKKIKIKSEEDNQKFLFENRDNLAFVTEEIKGNVPIHDVNLNVPLWITGVNQIMTATTDPVGTETGRTKLDDEIESVIEEQGWVVALMGMYGRGMTTNQAVAKFQAIESYYNGKFKLPKGGWFNSRNNYGTLPETSSRFPRLYGFTLDATALADIEERIKSVYETVPKEALPDVNMDTLNRSSKLVIKNGEVTFILPTEYSDTVKFMVQRGFDKRQIILATEKLEKKTKPLDRLITFYPKSNAEIDFYPDKEYNVPVRLPVANLDHGTRFSDPQPNPPSGDWS